jgi:hypothetical protein
VAKYIFLDTWVYKKLTNSQFERQLTEFVNAMGYTVLTTPLSFVELYNPGWQDVNQCDRVRKTAEFLSHVPCVIVRPEKVWRAEMEAGLSPLEALPIELNLQDLPKAHGAPALLLLLRRDPTCVEQGFDFALWCADYSAQKTSWLGDVERIIENACANGCLKCDNTGKFVELELYRELFLFYLDLRLACPEDASRIRERLAQQRQTGQQTQLTAVRLTSLCFWYSYVNVDNARKMKRSGSDIGDFFQISLLPYCAAFTVDRTMDGMLRRIPESIRPVNCEMFTSQSLMRQIVRG